MANYPPRTTRIDGRWNHFGDTVNLQTWLYYAGYYNRYRDGDWGYWTTYALQAYLRTKWIGGYPKRRVYPGRIDGDFGPMTKAAMGDAACNVIGGRYMGVHCGGYSSSIDWPHWRVVKCWQYFLNSNT